MEDKLILVFFNPMYYENEIWSNTFVLYGKHFEHVFGSVLEPLFIPINWPSLVT